MIFTGTNIRIEIDTEIDLNGATDTVIRYKFGNTVGEWQASIDGTKLYYDTYTDDLSTAGPWQFQGVFTLAGKRYKTEIAKETIQNPIPKPEQS